MGKLKGKTAKKGALGRSDTQQKEEARFYRCPSGHSLPHKTNAGNCTPVWCAGQIKPKKDALAKRAPGEDKPTPFVPAEDKEEVRIARAQSRRQARLRAIDFPEKEMEGAEAEQWADRKLVKLLPEAVALLEFDLKYGDDDAKARAAQEIRNATGRGRKDSGGGASAIFNVVMQAPASGAPPMPWMQRVDPKKLPDGGDGNA